MTTTDIPALDEAKLEAFVGQAVVDMGSAISGLLLHLVPGQATFASLMVEARLMTLRSLGSVACRFRQAM